jgi:hypothetical protein
MANLQDTDLILVGRGGTSFNTQYSDLKDSLTTDIVGDGQIQVNAGEGLTATGDNATANQDSNSIRVLSLNSGLGLEINDGDGSVQIDMNYLNQNLDTFPEAPADGNLYGRRGDNGTWVRALLYDIATLQDLP